MNKVSESNFSIRYWSIFESTQLTLVDEIIWNHMKLKTFTDNFLNELSQGIKEDDEPELFWEIIWLFIGFWNDDSCRSFEMKRPVT